VRVVTEPTGNGSPRSGLRYRGAVGHSEGVRELVFVVLAHTQLEGAWRCLLQLGVRPPIRESEQDTGVGEESLCCP
jgi:hypothetical protein